MSVQINKYIHDFNSSSNHVYIVDIAILTNIKQYCDYIVFHIYLVYIVDIYCRRCNVFQHRDDIESTSYSFFLVYVHRRQRFVYRYQVDIVSTSDPFFLVYIVNIVYIAILIDNESTLCLHRNSSFLFTL